MKILASIAFVVTFSLIAGQSDHEKKLLDHILESQTLDIAKGIARSGRPIIENLYLLEVFDKATFEDLGSILQGISAAKSLEEVKSLITAHNLMHEQEEEEPISQAEPELVSLEELMREEGPEPGLEWLQVRVPKDRPRSMPVLSSKLREEPEEQPSSLLVNKWQRGVKPKGRPQSFSIDRSQQED